MPGWFRLATDLLALTLVGVGLTFCVLGVLGMFRMPDVFLRMHAASKALVLGASLVLAGVAILSTVQLGVKALGTMVFVFLTTPIASIALARAAYRRGDRMHGPMVINELARDRKIDGTFRPEEPD